MRLPPGAVVRWRAIADEPTPADLSILTPGDLVRYDTVLDPGARTRGVVARALLRDTLREVLRTDDVVDIATSDRGAPYLAAHPDIRVSVAHTRGLAAVVVARGQPVGIDVEALDRFVGRSPPAVERWLTAAEREGVPHDATASSRRLLELWTAKEAAVKAAGVGLSVPLRDLAVIGNTIRWSTTEAPARWWAVRWTTTSTGHLLAVAWPRSH